MLSSTGLSAGADDPTDGVLDADNDLSSSVDTTSFDLDGMLDTQYDSI